MEFRHVFENVAEAVKNAPANAVYDITVLPDQYIEILEQLPDGAAVLIQKPMGNDLAQAREIVAVCERKNLVAAINFQLRFASFVSAARYLINQGIIGDLYDLEFKVTVNTPWELFPLIKEHPRLEILFHSVHYIDCIRSFLGNPKGVYAKTSQSSFEKIILLPFFDYFGLWRSDACGYQYESRSSFWTKTRRKLHQMGRNQRSH